MDIPSLEEKLRDARMHPFSDSQLNDIPGLDDLAANWRRITEELDALIGKLVGVLGNLDEESVERVGQFISAAIDLVVHSRREATDATAIHGYSDSALYEKFRRSRDQLKHSFSELKKEQQLGVSAVLLAGLARKESKSTDTIIELKDRLSDLDAKAPQLLESLSAKEKKITELIGKRQRQETRESFVFRAEIHQRSERWAKIAFALTLIVLACAFGWLVDDMPTTENGIVFAAFALKHSVALIGASALCRIALRRWNLERHLSVTYNHRVAVLDQYEKFNESIRDKELDAKTELRLKMVDVLFRDPETGYLDSSASDVSVTPITQFVDRASAVAGSARP